MNKIKMDEVRTAFSDEKRQYKLRMEKSLVMVLAGHIILLTLSRKLPERPKRNIKLPRLIAVTSEIVPMTRRGNIPLPPSRPQVPIPTEDEYLPEDETIETTDLTYDDFIPQDAVPDDGTVYSTKFKEVEEEEPQVKSGNVTLSIFVNAFGHVDTVRVVSNTTNSKRFEEDMINKAYRTRYRFQKAEARWIEQTYPFEKK